MEYVHEDTQSVLVLVEQVSVVDLLLQSTFKSGTVSIWAFDAWIGLSNKLLSLCFFLLPWFGKIRRDHIIY